MSSILRSSKFVRYIVGAARNIIISNRSEVDGSLWQRSQHLGAISSNFSSSSSFQAGYSLDSIIRRLDEDARRVGRIPLREVEEVLSEIRLSKKATASQSLMIIRCCGNLVPEEIPEKRTQLVNEIWKTLEKLGVSLDISHYNALLKVYLENEYKFSPAEFLAKLEKEGIEPNRVTYQRLVAGYCQMGDIAGATKILEYMKEKQLPVSEGVFNALILGHSQADDMQSAEGMLGVMKQANLEPSNETYTTLLCGYARRGDTEAIDRLLTDCKIKDILLTDKDILEITYTAAVNGHDQLVDKVLKNIRYMMAYNQDAGNVIIRLITNGKDEAAYKVFQTMQPQNRPDTEPKMSGHFLIKHFIKTKRPISDTLALCDRLQNDGHTSYGIWLAVEASFHVGDIDLTLGLLRAMKERGLEVRSHYFWPSLVTAGKAGDTKRIVDIVKAMKLEFEVPVTPETLKDYCFRYLKSSSPDEITNFMIDNGVGRAATVLALISHLISENKIKEAVNVAQQNIGINIKGMSLIRQLTDALKNTGDVKNVIEMIHIMSVRREREDSVVEDEEEEVPDMEEVAGRLLINVSAQKEAKKYIPELLKELVSRGLGISSSCAELVESRLQGSELTPEISQLLAQLSTGDLTPQPLQHQPRVKQFSSTTGATRDTASLEQYKEKLKSNGPPERLAGILRSLLQAYCSQGDLENALKIKQEYTEELKFDMWPGMWAYMLELYCSKEDLEGAKECLNKIKESSGVFELDPSKLLKMAKLHVQAGQLEEAIKLIQTVKPREAKTEYNARAAAWQLLTAVAETTKDPEQVKKLFNILIEHKYVETTNIFLGPIVKAYLLRDDLEGALKEFENCVHKYRATPWKNELAMCLIEKEDATNLQKLVDLSTQVHGEINSLYDLVASFVECGRIRQARKILETPGLSARSNRLQFTCERYKNEGKVAPLEGLVEATKDLPHIDRSDIYYNLLETYCQADSVEKALELWTQMQDEDVNVSEEFLAKLGHFLEEKGVEVPFEIPQNVAIRERTSRETQRNFRTERISPSPIASALQAGDLDGALKIKEQLLRDGKPLARSEVNHLMNHLLDKGRTEDAVNLLLSSEEGKVPIPLIRILSYLVNRIAQEGKLELMKKIGDHLQDDIKRLTSFSNRYMMCALAAGKAKAELDQLEQQIEKTSTADELDHLAMTFPKGGIYGVLNSAPSYYDQVARIADKYFEKGLNIPANCLVMFHVAEGQFDKAKQLYEQYKINNSSRIEFRNVLFKARVSENPKLVEDLIMLLKDAPAMTPESTGLLYSNVINLHLKKGDDDTALKRLEEGLNVIPIEMLHTLTLTRLKEALEAKNKPFNYTIPPKDSRGSSSSSSSSSESDTKQKLAAKH